MGSQIADIMELIETAAARYDSKGTQLYIQVPSAWKGVHEDDRQNLRRHIIALANECLNVHIWDPQEEDPHTFIDKGIMNLLHEISVTHHQ